MLMHLALTPLEAESTASETRKTTYDLESWRAATAARHGLKAMLVYIRASAQRARRRIARAEQKKNRGGAGAHAPVPVGAANPGPRLPPTPTPPPCNFFYRSFGALGVLAWNRCALLEDYMHTVSQALQEQISFQ